MKVIGTAGEGYILSATRDEVANLIGYFSGYDVKQLQVGDNIRIGSMYHQLRNLQNKRAELENIQKTLRMTADLLTAVQPLIPAVTAEPDKKEETKS